MRTTEAVQNLHRMKLWNFFFAFLTIMVVILTPTLDEKNTHSSSYMHGGGNQIYGNSKASAKKTLENDKVKPKQCTDEMTLVPSSPSMIVTIPKMVIFRHYPR